MNLVLFLEGEEKVFTAPFVSGLVYRKLMQMDETIDYSDISLNEFDKIAGFIAEVFNNQFTINEFLEGTESHRILDVALDVFTFVRTGEDPKNREKTDEGDEGNGQGE
jgi:hypothetical protein